MRRLQFEIRFDDSNQVLFVSCPKALGRSWVESPQPGQALDLGVPEQVSLRTSENPIRINKVNPGVNLATLSQFNLNGENVQYRRA